MRKIILSQINVSRKMIDSIIAANNMATAMAFVDEIHNAIEESPEVEKVHHLFTKYCTNMLETIFEMKDICPLSTGIFEAMLLHKIPPEEIEALSDSELLQLQNTVRYTAQNITDALNHI